VCFESTKSQRRVLSERKKQRAKIPVVGFKSLVFFFSWSSVQKVGPPPERKKKKITLLITGSFWGTTLFHNWNFFGLEFCVEGRKRGNYKAMSIGQSVKYFNASVAAAILFFNRRM
jgi:hypothetical protein